MSENQGKFMLNTYKHIKGKTKIKLKLLHLYFIEEKILPVKVTEEIRTDADDSSSPNTATTDENTIVFGSVKIKKDDAFLEAASAGLVSGGDDSTKNNEENQSTATTFATLEPGPVIRYSNDSVKINPNSYELDLNHQRIGKIQNLETLVNLERYSFFCFFFFFICNLVIFTHNNIVN